MAPGRISARRRPGRCGSCMRGRPPRPFCALALISPGSSRAWSWCRPASAMSPPGVPVHRRPSPAERLSLAASGENHERPGDPVGRSPARGAGRETRAGTSPSAFCIPGARTAARKAQEARVHPGSYGLTPAAGQPPAGPARSGTWPVRSGLVPPLAEGFIARTETVPGLEAALVPGAAVALVPGETTGDVRDWPGSCGKTQLAAYLAGSLWRSRGVDLLAWVAATSRASVLSGYGQAAAKLGLDHADDAEAVAARFLAWLEGTSRPWLLVLDDLRDAADLDGLRPAGPAGRVLVAPARAATVSAEHRVLVLAVPAFSTREALNYLSGRLTTDPHQRSGAIDLAGELGCEPAALAQANAVIVSSGIRCREYRDYFARRRAQLAAAGTGPQPAAEVTWTLSAGHAGQLAPDGGTWPVLALAALLDGQAIPGTVFTPAGRWHAHR